MIKTTTTMKSGTAYDKHKLNKSHMSSILGGDTAVQTDSQNEIQSVLDSIEDDTITFGGDNLNSMSSKDFFKVVGVPI